MSITKEKWLNKTFHWKYKWTQFPPEVEDDSNGISLYKIVQILNKNLKNDSAVIADAGSCGYVLAQSLQLKNNQRYILDSGQMSLGAWPMSIGVSLAKNKGHTILCVGDGSFNTNNSKFSTLLSYLSPFI